jgi:GNAT superfamily N-acetyltransferase
MMSAVKQEGYVFLGAGTDRLRDIVELKLAMFRDAGAAHLLAKDAADRILSSYRELYTCNRAAHFLAVRDGRIVGMAGAFIKSDIPYCYFAPPLYGFIGDVYTIPEHRRRGLARMLSRRALDWLRSQPVAAVRLLASPQGRAIYEELGFTPSDEMVLSFD